MTRQESGAVREAAVMLYPDGPNGRLRINFTAVRAAGLRAGDPAVLELVEEPGRFRIRRTKAGEPPHGTLCKMGGKGALGFRAAGNRLIVRGWNKGWMKATAKRGEIVFDVEPLGKRDEP